MNKPLKTQLSPLTFINSFISLSTITLLLIGCAIEYEAPKNETSEYRVSTNLDAENFENYFAPSKVKILQDETELETVNYEYVGLVEGQDCQTKAHLATPDPIIARTNARRTAYKKKANAIIFSECITLDEPPQSACLSTLVCYGSIYKVWPKENLVPKNK